ncbi:MAG TPA: EamA family transporter, partial [Fibrobacteria bacterium]|nr:EamA family transporter [Fibrobacteria bacterium]
MKIPRLPLAMLFLAALSWGLCIPIMKALGVEQTILSPESGSLSSSLATLAVRFGLAGASVAFLARVAPWRLTRKELLNGAGLGALTAASMFLQVDSLNYTSASVAGFLIALYCVVVPLFAWAMGLRRLTPILAASCLLVLLGLGILAGVRPDDLALGRGEWENIGAAILFAAQILWIGRLPPGDFDPSRLT